VHISATCFDEILFCLLLQFPAAGFGQHLVILGTACIPSKGYHLLLKLFGDPCSSSAGSNATQPLPHFVIAIDAVVEDSAIV
jgi:hypothetical protein